MTVVLVAAGGTGGHVFPGLATADALRRARPDTTVEFVGTAERLEARLVPEAGWTLHTVPAAALTRRVSPATLKLPFVLAGAVRRARRVIADRRADAAVCFGGYTSVPLALAARRARLPLVVHEQNAVPGVANRLAARFADAVAVSFPAAQHAFGRRRTVLTGNPVRPGYATLDRAALRDEALRHFDLDPSRRTLLVFGGSQGARRINRAVTGSAGRWPDPDRLQILHAAGRTTHDETRAAWDAAPPGGPLVRCLEFIERMDLAYAVADLVVCRAGASTIAELTALGLPAVLVPYPHATDDHQTANARGVADAGGAAVIADAELDADRLVATAAPLLGDDARRTAMAEAAAAFGRPDAADALAALVLETLDQRSALR